MTKQANWQLVVNKEGVKICLATLASSIYKSFQGIVTMQASISQITDALADIKQAHLWLYNCKQVKLIAQQDYEYWTYAQTKMPWPIKDRDLILHSKVEQQTDNSIIIHLSTEPNKVPVNVNHVRIRKLTGYWQLVAVSPNKTQVTYQLTLDPAGNIPVWLANQFVTEAPFQTLKGLRNYLENQSNKL